MQKYILILILGLALGCAKGGGGTPAPANGTNAWPNFAVTTSAELPACAGDIIGRMYYIETESTFKVCKTTGWTQINVKGADGTSAPTVTSIKEIERTNVDYCTQFSSDICGFTGGQVVSYSDGSAIVSYSWIYYIGTDSDRFNESFYLPASWPGFSSSLAGSVARGDGNRVVYISYSKAPQSAFLWLDVNQNQIYDVSVDEKLDDLTLTEML